MRLRLHLRKHQLEEAAPRQVPNYARPQTKVQSAVPVLPEAKNGPAYQSTRSQTYNSPAAIPSRAVQPRAVQPPIFQGLRQVFLNL